MTEPVTQVSETTNIQNNYVPTRKMINPLFVRVDDYTAAILDNIQTVTNESKAQIIRKALHFLRIMMDPSLPLDQLVSDQDWKKSLGEILKPLPMIQYDEKEWKLFVDLKQREQQLLKF